MAPSIPALTPLHNYEMLQTSSNSYLVSIETVLQMILLLLLLLLITSSKGLQSLVTIRHLRLLVGVTCSVMPTHTTFKVVCVGVTEQVTGMQKK